MATVNVNREVVDSFYRYKMPLLRAKVEGKGNGTKTVIVNMVKVAKALGRPPSYSTKYFGCELGAQVQMVAAKERFVVNGAHDAIKLQDLLDGFIKRFVLCKECNNPETNLVVTRKQLINQVCMACGHRASIDMRHKLTTHIIKNPPTNVSPEKQKGVKGESKTPSDPEDNVGLGSGSLAAPLAAGSSFDEDDWAVDTGADAVKQRMTDLTAAAANLAVTDDLELLENKRLDLLEAFILKEKESGRLVPGNAAIFKEATRLEILEKGVFLVAAIVLDSSVLQQLVRQLRQNAKLFLKFLNNNKKAQKLFLGAIENLVGNKYPALMPSTTRILMTCFRLELVDEDVFFEWEGKISKRYVDKKTSQTIREHAAPFLKWLREAESESESEDEEDEEDEEDGDDGSVVYCDKSQSEVDKDEREKRAAENEADDDLDIDNI